MMKKRIWKLLSFSLLICGILFGSQTAPLAAETSEKEIAFPMSHEITVSADTVTDFDHDLLFTESSLPTIAPEALRDLSVYPGGMPFGVKFYTDGVTVVGFCDVETEKGKVNPAAAAGLKPKDMIIKINGDPLISAADLTSRIESSGGTELRLLCRRAGHEFETILKPAYCPGESRYKTGIWVRDSGAGIGTVTFILPDTGTFAGLGHGICDSETGALVPMKRGSVSDVTISAVVKGQAGDPGELKGYFNAGKVGSLLGNSSCGVWGMFSEVPEIEGEPLPVGLRDEIEEGDAYILCTLDTNKIGKYAVRISNINRDATGSKCYTVTVTDPKLLAATGGIVQGMSGSPIIQNGKIVGAITHVLINDPTTGYGIFLENMLVNLPLLAR